MLKKTKLSTWFEITAQTNKIQDIYAWSKIILLIDSCFQHKNEIILDFFQCSIKKLSKFGGFNIMLSKKKMMISGSSELNIDYSVICNRGQEKERERQRRVARWKNWRSRTHNSVRWSKLFRAWRKERKKPASSVCPQYSFWGIRPAQFSNVFYRPLVEKYSLLHDILRRLHGV